MKPFVVMVPDFGPPHGAHDRWWVVTFNGRGEWCAARRHDSKADARADAAMTRRRLAEERKARRAAK